MSDDETTRRPDEREARLMEIRECASGYDASFGVTCRCPALMCSCRDKIAFAASSQRSDLLAEIDTLLAELEAARKIAREKMLLADEYIVKHSARFLAFEEFEDALDAEDSVAWDAAFADLKAECARFGITVIHPDKHHADSSEIEKAKVKLAAVTKRAELAERRDSENDAAWDAIEKTCPWAKDMPYDAPMADYIQRMGADLAAATKRAEEAESKVWKEHERICWGPWLPGSLDYEHGGEYLSPDACDTCRCVKARRENREGSGS